MDELINYNGYEEFKQAVNRVLNRTVEDFVLTGYLLKQARDTDILQGSGYADEKDLPGTNTNWMPLRYRDI